MTPATQTDLDNIAKDYQAFLKLGNSEMKSAWLAVNGRGFTEIIKSNKTNILLLRESDDKFIVYSWWVDELKPEEIIRKTTASFHVDESVLEANKL